MYPSNLQSDTACAGLLLAGGESRRMGRDKALLEIDGEPLWRRQLRTLSDIGLAKIFLTRGGAPPLCGLSSAGSPHIEPVSDALPASGPLAGLVSGLRATPTPFLLVLAVDMPMMTPHFLQSLLAQAAHTGRGVVPECAGFLEPLAALYPSACLPEAETALFSSQLSLQKLARTWLQHGIVDSYQVPTHQRHLFTNLNTAQDLAQCQMQSNIQSPSSPLAEQPRRTDL
jgi:molybdopterin-guanine dinucleotide biosynthesis protein A